VLRAHLLLFLQLDVINVAVAVEGQVAAFLLYFLYPQGWLQVELQFLAGLQHPVLHSIQALDAAISRVYPDLEVVVRQVPPGPLRGNSPPQRILPVKNRRLRPDSGPASQHQKHYQQY
jgi:hypothetical protein